MAESDNKPSQAVGYRKPPVANQYRPGISGNPRGRPKGSQNAVKVVGKVLLDQTVSVTEQGQTRRMTKGEAFVKVILDGARKGDRSAANASLALMEKVKRMTPPPERDPHSQVGPMLIPRQVSPEEWGQMLAERREADRLRQLSKHKPVTRAPKGIVRDDPDPLPQEQAHKPVTRAAKGIVQ